MDIDENLGMTCTDICRKCGGPTTLRVVTFDGVTQKVVGRICKKCGKELLNKLKARTKGKDEFGSRMKIYEKQLESKMLPGIPVCSRLDGKAFSSFTKGLKKPYDKDLTSLMVLVTKALVEESNALIGYTQSDEISLIWLQNDARRELFMGGKRSKMTSILASLATATFNKYLSKYLPEKVGKMALFDCRVWSVPSKMEAANVLLWREQDATRNSIQALGQFLFSHKSLMHKSCSEIQEMLWQEKNINWNDYPSEFKRGTYIQRRCVKKPFTIDEIDKLPPLHEARKNPDLIIERHETRVLQMPKFSSVSNKIEVIFDGQDPEAINS